MSKYSDFEQVGELGKTYSSSDKRLTAEAGDIMLYSEKNCCILWREHMGIYSNWKNQEFRRRWNKTITKQWKCWIEIKVKNLDLL